MASAQGNAFELGYQPPYGFAGLLDFFRLRQLEGVEKIGADAYERTARIPLDGAEVRGWLRVEHAPARNTLKVTVSESLVPAIPLIARRLQRQFDTESDPIAIAADLAPLEEAVPGALVAGTRLPGCFDPFETAARAILGQQVSVAAACKLAARIADAYGTPVETGIDGLHLAFPSAEEVAALGSAEEAFGPLGVIKSRSRCIAQIARMLVQGELDFGPNADPSQQMEHLLAIKGIGPWTAGYIAMRVFGHPDVFLETDAGIKHALPDLDPRQRLQLAEAWRPWRSYANIGLWNSLG